MKEGVSPAYSAIDNEYRYEHRIDMKLSPFLGIIVVDACRLILSALPAYGITFRENNVISLNNENPNIKGPLCSSLYH